MTDKAVASSNAKEDAFKARIKYAVDRHFTPNPWKSLDAMEMYLLCMYADWKITRPELNQGLIEARTLFAKKVTRRLK
jgi:hypothetical protein